MADVAAVIGNYEGEAVLGDCLASLAAQSPQPAEVVVADAGSADGSAGVAETFGARFVGLENRGLGHLYNEGTRAVQTTYVLLLNNDVALEPECLGHLVRALDDDPARLAAAPRQLDWSGERTLRGRITLRRGRLFGEPLPGLRLDLCGEADAPSPALMADGAALLVRRQRLLDLGGFDESFFMEFEDLDLCWRGWLAGYPTVYVPAAVVRHRVGAVTHAGVHARRLASAHHNVLRFALKCLPAGAAARVVAGELLRLPRHPRAIVRALVAVGRELHEIARLRRSIRPSRESFERMLEDPVR